MAEEAPSQEEHPSRHLRAEGRAEPLPQLSGEGPPEAAYQLSLQQEAVPRQELQALPSLERELLWSQAPGPRCRPSWAAWAYQAEHVVAGHRKEDCQRCRGQAAQAAPQEEELLAEAALWPEAWVAHSEMDLGSPWPELLI